MRLVIVKYRLRRGDRVAEAGAEAARLGHEDRQPDRELERGGVGAEVVDRVAEAFRRERGAGQHRLDRDPRVVQPEAHVDRGGTDRDHAAVSDDRVVRSRLAAVNHLVLAGERHELAGEELVADALDVRQPARPAGAVLDREAEAAGAVDRAGDVGRRAEPGAVELERLEDVEDLVDRELGGEVVGGEANLEGAVPPGHS